MEQFKVVIRDQADFLENIDHIITQHNALCDYLEEREGEKAKGVGVCCENGNFGDDHECRKSQTINLPNSSRGGSGTDSGPIGTAGYDPRYKNGKAPDTLVEEHWGNLGNTVVIPKPEWWEDDCGQTPIDREIYLEALNDVSNALGITINLS